WLAEHQNTFAIQHLTKHNPSFKKFWQQLVKYRQNNITEFQARKLLKNSCWILPEWIDEILQKCVEARKYVTSNPQLEDNAPENTPFLSLPVLDLSESGQVQFKTSLCNLPELDLTAEHYDLYIGRTRYARLIQQGDFTYFTNKKDYTIPAQDTDGHTLAALVS